ncbi:hypothetical protein IL306_001356 [Fusarium sp. DS 682]|nr:hypothetical protein IL306_001356 [Fusarium sp. DS 682]
MPRKKAESSDDGTADEAEAAMKLAALASTKKRSLPNPAPASKRRLTRQARIEPSIEAAYNRERVPVAEQNSEVNREVDIRTTAINELSSPTGWLSGDVIDYLARKTLELYDASTISIFSWLKMAEDAPEALPDELPDRRMIFWPVNTANRWSLLAIHQYALGHIAHHYDSMHLSSTTEAIGEKLKGIRGLLKVKYIETGTDNGGVFVISAIKYLAMCKPIPQDLDLRKERQAWIDKLSESAMPSSSTKPTLGNQPDTFDDLSPRQPPPADCLENPASQAANTLLVNRVEDGPAAESDINEDVQQIRADIESDKQTLKKIKKREKFKEDISRRLTSLGSFFNDVGVLERCEQHDISELLDKLWQFQINYEATAITDKSNSELIANLEKNKAKLRKALKADLENKKKDAQEKKTRLDGSAAVVQELEEKLRQARNARQKAAGDSNKAQKELKDLDLQIRQLQEKTIE